MELDPVETRILGAMLEKERVTPEAYPLTLNGLIAACNQSTNREPVVAYDERTVERGLDRLRQKGLAALLHTAGARVPKYRHRLPDQYELTAAETALLCVLLLRGPQTPGEGRARAERLGGPVTLAEVESTLQGLARGDAPLVRALPARPGQKEVRYVQLLSGPYAEPEPVLPTAREVAADAVPSPPPDGRPAWEERLAALTAEVGELRAALAELQEAFATFRKAFE